MMAASRAHVWPFANAFSEPSPRKLPTNLVPILGETVAVTRSRLSVWLPIGIAAVSVLLTGAMPPAPPDDAGHVAFVRQAVPKLLGRKPRGAEEVKVLADLADLFGREAVLRALMEEPEFIEHWTNVIVDDLRVQREPVPNISDALPDCFGNAQRPGQPDAALARHVSDAPASSPEAAGAFNMIDLIRSALVLDNLSPIFRAHPVALRSQLILNPDEPKVNEEAVGNRFSQHLLNRAPSCLTCHNSRFSMSGITGQEGWPRTHPIPYDLEAAVYGSSFANTQSVIKGAFPIFRDDQFEPFAGVPGPWGLSGCGGLIPSLAKLPQRPTNFAGLIGTAVGLADLAQAFKEGVDSLAANGPILTQQPNRPYAIPKQQALAYLTAVTVAENVWEEVVGEKLTIANTYPRNLDQRDALIELGEQTFLKYGWSLKTLLMRIMTSDYFNRRSPDLGSGTTAYRLPMILDPWVADDPRSAPPPPPLDPKELNNGQGELVHRQTPDGLLYAIATALGWPAPTRFPDGTGFATPSLIRASGQYINEAEQGRRGVDFQGLLVWEAELGQCRKPPDAKADWIDRMLAEMRKLDGANPATPVTVADVVATAKDWLIGDARIASTPPSGSPLLQSERDAVAALLGAMLDAPASSVADLEPKLRTYCGVLLKTPQFMLTGIDAAGGELAFPRLRVCNGAPCSYGEMCTHYARGLGRAGQTVECHAGNRTALLRAGAPAPIAGGAGAVGGGWLQSIELSKKAHNGAWFEAESLAVDDIPLPLRQTGPAHHGLAGDPPVSLDEAKARLSRYRASKSFTRSHPKLEKQ